MDKTPSHNHWSSQIPFLLLGICIGLSVTFTVPASIKASSNLLAWALGISLLLPSALLCLVIIRYRQKRLPIDQASKLDLRPYFLVLVIGLLNALVHYQTTVSEFLILLKGESTTATVIETYESVVSTRRGRLIRYEVWYEYEAHPFGPGLPSSRYTNSRRIYHDYYVTLEKNMAIPIRHHANEVENSVLEFDDFLMDKVKLIITWNTLVLPQVSFLCFLLLQHIVLLPESKTGHQKGRQSKMYGR